MVLSLRPSYKCPLPSNCVHKKLSVSHPYKSAFICDKKIVFTEPTPHYTASDERPTRSWINVKMSSVIPSKTDAAAARPKRCGWPEKPVL